MLIINPHVTRPMKRFYYTPLLITILTLLSAANLGASIGLTAPATTPAGGPFEVTWTAEEPKGRIDIVQDDGAKIAGASYTYANPKKTATLTAPVAAGKYGIQFVNAGKTLQLITFEVTPVTATLNTPAKAAMNESFEVTWTGPNYKGDRIRIGTAEGKPITGASSTYPSNAKSTTIGLTAPVEPGSYTVLYEMSSVILAQNPL